MRLVVLSKAKKMPVGTVSRGRKKVAEGKWVEVKKGKRKARKPKKEMLESSSKAFYEKAVNGPPVKSSMFPNLEHAEFNQKPGMMGHYYARTHALFADHRLGRYMKDPKTALLVAAALPLDADDWHSFNNMDDSAVKNVSVILKNVRMKKPLEDILNDSDRRVGAIRFGPVSNLVNVLRVALYLKDPNKAIEREAGAYRFYGVSPSDANVRAKTSLEKLSAEGETRYQFGKGTQVRLSYSEVAKRVFG